MPNQRLSRPSTIALALLAAPAAVAQGGASEPDQMLVARYNDHLVTLASPYMEGRVPGSEGMERAKDYCEYYFRKFDLKPAFPSESGEAFASFRDPFELGGTWKVGDEALAMLAGGRAMELEAESDFVFTGLGEAGSFTGPAAFVGFSIDNGPDGWSSYGENDSLDGHVAIMFRFEPMDADGNSRWGQGGWSSAAAFTNKLRAAIERGAEAVVIVNTPGAADGRVAQLNRFTGGGAGAGVPVFMTTPEALNDYFQAAGGKSTREMLSTANSGGGITVLDGVVSLKGEGGRQPLIAENVGAILEGRGDLADEYIVVGGHLDHLGMGYFGSRAGPGKLHPGADDNASGSAGVLLIAELLAESYAQLPAGADARSVLFIEFSGEESGLNGSFHYTSDPIVAAEDHVLMVNWDMIGRCLPGEESGLGRLTLAGANTGEGLSEFIDPFTTPEASGLEIVQPAQMSGASDHTPFYNAGVPVLFSIIADFHADYHTPEDVTYKINREDAVRTVEMYHDIVLAAAQRDGRFAYVDRSELARRSNRERRAERQQQPPAAGEISVRFGIMPANYDSEGVGIPIARVSPDGPAQKAGLEDGDTLVRWDGQKIQNIEQWMGMLVNYKPGDKVKVGVKRDGEEVTLEVELGSK
ncbi:MAG: M28 family peptidase [Planctomycetota bacterium]